MVSSEVIRQYEALKRKESFGFLLETLAFISTGYLLAQWKLLYATITLLISLGLAFYVGELIKKVGVLERDYGTR